MAPIMAPVMAALRVDQNTFRYLRKGIAFANDDFI